MDNNLLNFAACIFAIPASDVRKLLRVFLKSFKIIVAMHEVLQLDGVRQMSKLFAFVKDESGATAIEYGLIAAGISVVIIATVNAIGTTLNGKFTSISTQMK